MKKLATLAVLLGGFSLASFAQDSTTVNHEGRKGPRQGRHNRHMENKTPEEWATLKTERLDKKLSFTDAQKKEVYSLQLNQAERKAVHMDKMKQLHQEWRQEMKTDSASLAKVLTADQQKVLQEQKDQRKGDRRGSRGGKRGDGVGGGKSSYRVRVDSSKTVTQEKPAVKIDATKK